MPSTVDRQPSTVNRQPSTVDRQPSTDGNAKCKIQNAKLAFGAQPFLLGIKKDTREQGGGAFVMSLSTPQPLLPYERGGWEGWSKLRSAPAEQEVPEGRRGQLGGAFLPSTVDRQPSRAFGPKNIYC